jgi:PKD repeat protein
VAYNAITDKAYIANYEGASISILSAEAPRASFTGTPLNGDAPLDVQFTSIVTGSVTSYSWIFGDGGVSTLSNPSHTYNSAGSFGVELTVTGPGGTFSISQDAYVMVNPAPGVPTADFSADITSGIVPLQVTFTAVTTGTVDTWAWNFGDGGTAASGPVVSHTYITPGRYPVSLVVSNGNGSFTVSKPGYIFVLPDLTYRYIPLVSK